MPTVDTSPREFAPTMQGGLQWSRWGMYVESKGKQGEQCDMPSACKLMDYLQEWETSTDPAGAGMGTLVRASPLLRSKT